MAGPSDGIDVRATRTGLWAEMHGESVALPPLWLRQHVSEPELCDALTGQRLFDPHRLPVDLAIDGVDDEADGFTVSFSDGLRARFERARLKRLLLQHHGELPTPSIWRASDAPTHRHDWHAIESHAEPFRAALQDFLSFGYVLIEHTPVEPDSILSVARRFGIVRETNFGALFNVVSDPRSNDLAYRSGALAAHTDNPYRDPVPGIQLLHCLVNETRGGESTLVDGLAVCEALLAEDADAFELLARIPVDFRFDDSDTALFDRHPLIRTDTSGRPIGIHYSPRLDAMPLLDEATSRAFQHARHRLSALLADPRFEIRFRLRAGELMMFDNNRVLHGRTAFDPADGPRHLQGCYIDRDGPASRWRVAQRETCS